MTVSKHSSLVLLALLLLTFSTSSLFALMSDNCKGFSNLEFKLKRIVYYDWLITDGNLNDNQQILYQFNFCRSKNLKNRTFDGFIQSDEEYINGIYKFKSEKDTIKSLLIGRLDKFELNELTDGFTITLDGQLCKPNIYYKTFINFHCDKTLGLPKLISDDEANCTTVFDWDTNQVCKKNLFDSENEIPCYLTSPRVDNNIYDLNDYVTIDLNSLILTDKLHSVTEKSHNFSIEINICRYSQALFQIMCKDSNAACVSMNHDNYFSYGFNYSYNSSSITRLKKVSLDKYSLQYDLINSTNQSLCMNSLEKPKMTINFICDTVNSVTKSPVLKSNETCNLEIDWHTDHACGIESAMKAKNTCRLRDDSKGINFNIEPLNKKGGYKISYSNSGTQYDLVLNICGLLNGYEKCSKRSSACQLKPNDPNFSNSVGSYLDSELSFVDEQLKLTMDNGSNCRSGLARKTVIYFKCDPYNRTNSIKYIYENECVYYLEWETFYACNIQSNTSYLDTKSDDSHTFNECKTYSGLKNHTFDFSFLFQTNHTVKSKNFTYKFNICPPKSYANKTSGLAIVREDNSKTTKNFGYYNKMEINQFPSHVIIKYTGEKCDDERVMTTIFLIECSPFQNIDPFIQFESDCFAIIVWPLREACASPSSNLNACSVYYDGVIYDLSALRHAYDSWPVKSVNNKTDYWMNICSGIKIGPNDHTKCPSNASLCSLDKNSNTISALAYESQMYLSMKSDGKGIEMLFNNTERACYSENGTNYKLENFTLIYIEFVCGDFIGTPQLNEKYIASKESLTFLKSTNLKCLTAFYWKTVFACKKYSESSLNMNVNLTDDGVIQDAEKIVSIDMREIFRRTFSDSSNPDKNKYLLNLNKNTPRFNYNNCTDAMICQVNEKENRNRDLGTSIVSKSLDLYLKIFEVVLISNHTLCSKSSYIKSIVRFHCDLNENFLFETQSNDCIYIFNLATEKICMTTNSSNSTMSTTAISTATASISTTTTKSSFVFFDTRFPPIIILSIVLVIIVLALILFNKTHENRIRLHKYVRLWCRSLGRVSWFGTTSSRMNHLSLSNWSSLSNKNTRIRAVRYSRLKNNVEESVFDGCEGLRNEDDSDFNNNESGEEIKALVDDDFDSFEVTFQSLNSLNSQNRQNIPNRPNRPNTISIANKKPSAKVEASKKSKKYFFDSPDDLDTILTDDYVKELELEKRTITNSNGSVNNVLSNPDNNSDDDLLDVI